MNEFMHKYLFLNKSTNISQGIITIRSKTLDLKTWTPWQYENDLCNKCVNCSETMDNFVRYNTVGRTY